jgi:ABC-type multidrug transport system fused ATPase/permease subunit
VVILDEATAHLDNVTEAALTHAFAAIARLVIAHRLRARKPRVAPPGCVKREIAVRSSGAAVRLS